MKKIIAGKLYNTETAKSICEAGRYSPSDFDAVHEELYRTNTGRFFIVGAGYRNGYGKPDGNMIGFGHKMFTVDEERAKEFIEEHGSAADYIGCFGEAEAA